MNKTLIACAALLAMIFVTAACEKAADATRTAGGAVNDAAKATGKALDNAAKATGKAVEKAADNTAGAVDAAGDYVNRQQLVKTAQDEFTNLKAKWHDLQGQIEKAGKSADERFMNLSERMAQGIDETDRKLGVVKEAGAEAWSDAKVALDWALRQTRDLYDYVVVEFGG